MIGNVQNAGRAKKNSTKHNLKVFWILSYTDEMMVVENHFEKGGIGAMHSHPHTQITYIVSGKFEFTIGEEKKIVSAGDTLLKKNGIEHGCVCLEEGILLDCFNPMRDEFVKD